MKKLEKIDTFLKAILSVSELKELLLNNREI